MFPNVPETFILPYAFCEFMKGEKPHAFNDSYIHKLSLAVYFRNNMEKAFKAIEDSQDGSTNDASFKWEF